MHDSRFYENEKKTRSSNIRKQTRGGRHKGKGYTIATPSFINDNFAIARFFIVDSVAWLLVKQFWFSRQITDFKPGKEQ